MKWTEVKPIAFFIGKFMALYVVCNLLYGWWVTAYEPKPDPMTQSVTYQSTWFLSLAGFNVSNATHPTKPTERILNDGKNIVSVYEGCNGVNVWIIFVSFLLAFDKVGKKLLIFLIVGTVVIHISNITRILAMFLISLRYPQAIYFFHKYLFTAVIYLIVFVMWYYWITYGRDTTKAS